MPLQWSEPRKPGEDGSPYDHVIAETPLGAITLEWKSWKKYDSPCGEMPWGELVLASTLDEAKSAVQAAWDAMAAKVSAMCSV